MSDDKPTRRAREDISYEIKAKRKEENAIRASWGSRRKEMVEGRRLSIQESLSMRNRNLKKLNAETEKERARLSEVYQAQVEAENDGFKESVAKAKALRDVNNTDSKQKKEDALKALREKQCKANLPAHDQHKADLLEIDEGFETKIEAIDKGEAEALKTVTEEIAELEKKLRPQLSGAAA